MNSTVQDHIAFLLKRLQIQNRHAKLLLACSAGIDSMVLLHALHKMKFTLEVAHVNFKLRGEESDQDEQHLKNWCTKNKIPLHIYQCSSSDFENRSKSIQELARDIRYKFFDRLLINHNFDYIVTAHHFDDSNETILMNLISGSGIKGLIGIPEKRDAIIRPMLSIKRSEILTYAKKNKIKWREDESNASLKYKRNRIRNLVIPALTKSEPDWEKGFHRTVKNLQSVSSFIEVQLEQFLNKNKINPSQLKQTIQTKYFTKSDYFLLCEYLRSIGFNQEQCELICKLKTTESKQFEIENKTLLKKDTLIKIFPKELTYKLYQLIASEGTYTLTKQLKINVEKKRYSNKLFEQVKNSNGQEILINERAFNFPFYIRNWKRGDSFKPFGMNGNKLVSDYLIDLKINTFEKKSTFVLLSGNSILWVIGHRASEIIRTDKINNSVIHFSIRKVD